MIPNRIQVLRLYKDLLRYGEMLTFTDKEYYKGRIKEEFTNNKNITVEEEIRFFYQVNQLRGKRTVDKSKVPELNEDDLEEHFIRGGGPGGQKVNKGNNCVYLVHKPTGLSVKVHEFRLQEENRKLARQKLTTMIDNLINKEESVENQKKQILEEKSRKRLQKQKKLNEMKAKWKQINSEFS